VKLRGTLRLALLMLLALLALGCTQPVPVDHADYIGHWRGDGVLLVIAANGQADYSRVRGNNRTQVSGPAHSFSTEGFKIGVGPLSVPFKVQSPPRETPEGWRMTVDKVELSRMDLSLGNPDAPSLRL
jgi:hypothetical protein